MSGYVAVQFVFAFNPSLLKEVQAEITFTPINRPAQ